MRLFRSSRAASATLCVCALLGAALGLAARSGAAHGPTHGPNLNPQGWTVLAPVTYKNLTIFPVRGRDLAGAHDYITLDEGIRAGTVRITEKGAVAERPVRRTRGAARQQQVAMNGAGRGDGASVNELALVNRSGKKLLLLAGEVVVGGKQDRIVQDDLIIPPVSVPVSLNVFCVEHGRWSHRASARAGGAPTEGPAPVADGFTSLGAISHPKLRAAAQDKKEQGEVWREVAANNSKLGTQNGTDTYQEVYANRKVAAQLGDYVRALEREVLQPGVVGAVVARNGRLVWADVFATSSLFARYWPKLLKSYAVDAVGDYASDARPGTEEARRYLLERAGEATTTGAAGVYQLVKVEHPRYAVFELRDVSLATPLRLHYNKMER